MEALITLIESWTEQLESGCDSAALIMDQSKAYDLVDHQILLRKLDSLGLDNLSLKFMESYLTD